MFPMRLWPARLPSGRQCVEMERRKLARSAGIRGVSYAALAAVLESLDGAGTSFGSIRRQVGQDIVAMTPYGAILKEVKLAKVAGGFSWTVVCPLSLPSSASGLSSAFGGMLLDKVRRNRPDATRPWRIIVYLDECSPGNLLAIEHLRKSWQIH